MAQFGVRVFGADIQPGEGRRRFGRQQGLLGGAYLCFRGMRVRVDAAQNR
jgi:hypothetical protein